MSYDVVDIESLGRYELLEDGRLLGYAVYDETRSGAGSDPSIVRDIHHTFIDPEQRGRGLGAVMVAGVLELAREERIRVVPTCPFVRAYMDDHPEDQDQMA